MRMENNIISNVNYMHRNKATNIPNEN